MPSGAVSKAFLYRDNWDDWGKYCTMFSLHIADENGEIQYIGSVKIGQQGLGPSPSVIEGHRAPVLPDCFEALSDNYFSLGQGEDYYESLNKLSDELCLRVLNGLRDSAANLDIFHVNRSEEVMRESLLRSVNESSVLGRLNRLTRGDAKLTKFSFTYQVPETGIHPLLEMGFEVIPESQPPTNIHVVIGRNGVGKSRCMRHIALTLLGRHTESDRSLDAARVLAGDGIGAAAFSGLIFVSFSAFDEFNLRSIESDSMACEYVGLGEYSSDEKGAGAKSFDDLGIEFANSLRRCMSGVKAERWRNAVMALEEDDLFAEADVTSLLESESGASLQIRALKLFKLLSSGHAIVLLTVTRLVELVDERTLVLIDEPEGHLHPPLLASFVRCLSNILVSRNGVAILATHSPVVLQEVPQSCVWKLRRSGAISIAERAAIQTFGENIGVLTREVFGLQVTKSGFHKVLQEAVAEGHSYQIILNIFDGQLGDEAKAILRGLIADREDDSHA